MRLIGSHNEMGAITFPREMDMDTEPQYMEGPSMTGPQF